MNLQNLDNFIIQIINQPNLLVLNMFFIIIDFSIYIYLLIILYIYYKNKNTRAAGHLFFSAIIGAVVTTILKYTIGRPRPTFSQVLYRNDPSFPSRTSFLAGIGIYFANKTFVKIYKLLSVIYLLLIPVASVYLGIHYFTDVIAGLALGVIFPNIITENSSGVILNRIKKSVKVFK